MKNILTKSIFSKFDQDWQFVQIMSERERKQFIKKVEKLNRNNCGFIHFAAKEYLRSLIEYSKPYFNESI